MKTKLDFLVLQVLQVSLKRAPETQQTLPRNLWDLEIQNKFLNFAAIRLISATTEEPKGDFAGQTDTRTNGRTDGRTTGLRELDIYIYQHIF